MQSNTSAYQLSDVRALSDFVFQNASAGGKLLPDEVQVAGRSKVSGGASNLNSSAPAAKRC